MQFTFAKQVHDWRLSTNRAEEYGEQDLYRLFQEVLCIRHRFCLQEQPGQLREMLWPPPK